MADNTENQSTKLPDAVTGDQALARLLDWYRAMGVDEAIVGVPTDWLERGPEPPRRYNPAPKVSQADAGGPRPVASGRAPPLSPRDPSPPRQPDRPPASPVAIADDVAEANAREIARKAASLDELHHLLADFDGCGLKATAKNMCFYRGAGDARVMIIGEAPGRDEDRAGVPFVGRAGQLLDKMLASIGLSEADTHITNVVYWRPPGNRVPTPQETLVCRPFLERQIQLVQPEVIVTVGGAAAKLILNTTQGIMRVRGKWQSFEVAGENGEAALAIDVMPTLHPAYLLRSPIHKRQAWRDLLAISARLDEAAE